MEEYNDKSNNVIIMELKQLQVDHEAIKNKLIQQHDEMIAIENKYNKLNSLLMKRLKGE